MTALEPNAMSEPVVMERPQEVGFPEPSCPARDTEASPVSEHADTAKYADHKPCSFWRN